MKLDNGAGNDVLTNSNSESKFSINASAQAFRILSDGIYEHKIAAIIRELACNAYDAHVEAGKRHEPFKVVLPNNLHPYFEIEDFGIGLDDDEVRTVYTSYFTSTKNDSNESIGAFGLGSKTPFAYTSTFTIIARKDGVERMYTAYIGSDGAPSVNKMLERETQESNGVKITVPVRSNDFGDFTKEAQWILSFFKVPPMVNDPNFEFYFEGVADEIEEGGIVVRQRPPVFRISALYNQRVYAVMGGVCYGINVRTLQERLNDPYFTKIVLKDMSSVAFLKFDIGELEVTASRESLSYDMNEFDDREDTLTRVVNKFAERVKELKKADIDAIDAMRHPLDAMRYVEDKYQIGVMGMAMFRYNGQGLSKYFHRNIVVPGNMPRVYVRTQNYRGLNRWATSKRGVGHFHNLLYVDKVNIVYIEGDYKKVGIDKHSRALLENKSDAEEMTIAFDEPLTKNQRGRIEKYLGHDNIVWHNLKDLREEAAKNRAKSPRAPSSPSVKLDETIVRAVSYQFDGDKPSCFSNRHNIDRIDLSNGNEYYYAEEELGYGGRLSYNGRKTMFPADNIAWLASAMGKSVTVVCMNSKNERKIMDNKVPRIDVLIKEFFDSEDNTNKIVTRNLSHNFMGSGFSDAHIDLVYESEAAAFKPKFDALEKELGMSIEEAANLSRLSNEAFPHKLFIENYDHGAIERKAEKIDEMIADIGSVVTDAYPMLLLCRDFTIRHHREKVKEYIKMVDAQATQA